jgi:hypothetical protein
MESHASNIGRVVGMMMEWMAASLVLSGCVVGYGQCLFTEPFKNTLTGHVHFRNFPAPDGIDNVPVLSLDRTAYIYSPAHSHQCLTANDVQLIGVAEFPQDIIEDSHVTVRGSVFEATSSREHTNFVMNVTSILPIRAPH